MDFVVEVNNQNKVLEMTFFHEYLFLIINIIIKVIMIKVIMLKVIIAKFNIKICKFTHISLNFILSHLHLSNY